MRINHTIFVKNSSYRNLILVIDVDLEQFLRKSWRLYGLIFTLLTMHLTADWLGACLARFMKLALGFAELGFAESVSRVFHPDIFLSVVCMWAGLCWFVLCPSNEWWPKTGISLIRYGTSLRDWLHVLLSSIRWYWSCLHSLAIMFVLVLHLAPWASKLNAWFSMWCDVRIQLTYSTHSPITGLPNALKKCCRIPFRSMLPYHETA